MRLAEHTEPFPPLSSFGLVRRARGGKPVGKPEPLSAPLKPDLYETVLDYSEPYIVTVGFVRPEPGDVPVPVEITIRRAFPLTIRETTRPRLPARLVVEESEPQPLSARDVRRLPLDRVVRAATVAADRGPIETMGELSKILVPRGRPTGGERSIKFYKEIAEAHREIEQLGESPAKVIARRKRVPENTVHQWIYKARDKGLLEPPPRARKMGG